MLSTEYLQTKQSGESGAEAASSTGDPASRAIETKAERPPLIDRRPPILGTIFKIYFGCRVASEELLGGGDNDSF